MIGDTHEVSLENISYFGHQHEMSESCHRPFRFLGIVSFQSENDSPSAVLFLKEEKFIIKFSIFITLRIKKCLSLNHGKMFAADAVAMSKKRCTQVEEHAT